MRRLIVCLLLILLLNTALPASAHANLARSEPAANTVLAEAPAEIRLWFTEPLEPNFSRIRLQDAGGAPVDTAASQIDTTDSTQMFLSLDDLPDGLYTVVWQVVSAADGHPTNGNFAFAVGDAAAGAAAIAQSGETIPVDSALIRGFHLFSLALIVGSIGFWLFVWQPTVNLPDADNRLFRPGSAGVAGCG
ncbi:MAG: copper resistance protein CopC [Anaerolineae bacterium]